MFGLYWMHDILIKMYLKLLLADGSFRYLMILGFSLNCGSSYFCDFLSYLHCTSGIGGLSNFFYLLYILNSTVYYSVLVTRKSWMQTPYLVINSWICNTYINCLQHELLNLCCKGWLIDATHVVALASYSSITCRAEH